jgi:Skp family chaperone for outer membrane proteins
MKKLFRTLALGLVAGAILSGSAVAQGRIATVDLTKAYNSYWKKRDAESLLKDEQTNVEKDLKAMQETYKKLNDEYQKLLDSASDPAVSTEEREKRKSQADEKLKQLKQKQEDFVAYRNRAEVDLTERKKSTISRIVTEIRNVVAARAKTAGYSLVLDAGNEAAVIYSSGENDITADIIKDLNANAPAAGGATDDTKTDKKSEKKK